MSTGDGDWGLWEGRDTGLMQTWPREISERMMGNNRIALDFITYGTKSTLDAIRDLTTPRYGHNKEKAMKTSELTGQALDWAVAKCEGYTGLHKIAGRMPHEPQLGILPPRKEYGVMDLWELSYSTDWAQGGPIIEREKMAVMTSVDDANEWVASIFEPNWNFNLTGPTPLIAAMRCYVASKLGDEVEIPKELL